MGPSPTSLEALIHLVEQGSWLNFIQRQGSTAFLKSLKTTSIEIRGNHH